MRRRSRTKAIPRDRGQRLALRDLAMLALRDGVEIAGQWREFTISDLADVFGLDPSHVGRCLAATRGALGVAGA